MLLRSSSTPVLGSLVSSIAAADSANNNETSSPFRHYPSSSFHGHNHNRLSFHPSPGSVHLSTVASCGSSPVSPSVVDRSSDLELKGFRRAQSDGNLAGLAYSACNGSDGFCNQNQSKRLSARHKCLMLQTIPSFSFYDSGTGRGEEDESDSDGEEEEVMAGVNGGSNDGFNSISLENLSLNEQVKVDDEKGVVGVEMFLPTGLEAAMDGGGRSGGGGGGEFNSAGSNGDDEIEEYYKKMVKENPGNPIVLGNYAQFLYQSKRDLQGAEEYYSRATLADPKDGETLSQYAKLVWELHRDGARASSYFERAVQASPQDCHVQAAYASFLWETDEDGDECPVPVAFREPWQALKQPASAQ